MWLFLKDLFLCLSPGLRVSLRGNFPCEGSSKRRPFHNVNEPNHNTHEAHNRTAKEANGDRWNAGIIAREHGGTRYQLETPRRITNVASGRLTKSP